MVTKVWSGAAWIAALAVLVGCGADEATAGLQDAASGGDVAAGEDTGQVDGQGAAETAGDGFAACKSVADCPAPSAPCRSMSCQPGVGCVELQLVDGAICDTGDPCILAGMCKLGACVAGPVRDCDDGATCTSDSCKDGTCVHTPLDGLGCDDGEPCTANDVCQGGVCKAGSGVCGCQADSDCDKLSNLCTGTYYCDTSGPNAACKLNASTVVSCPPSPSPCVVNTCDPASGSCKATPVAEGLLIGCDDGNACTSGDVCKGGGCVPGTDICGCKSDADCAGQDDGDLCNGLLYCNKGTKPASCALNPATIVTCPSVDDTGCSSNVCEPKSGACKAVPQPDGKACDDGTVCTTGEACKGGSCVAEANTCACTSDADCAGKDDGDLCNGTMFCDKSAGGGKGAICKVNPATVVSCPTVNDTFCLGNVCAPKTGTCQAQARNESLGCDDGDPCTQGEVCTGGACKASGSSDLCSCKSDGDCAALDDANVCNGQLFCDKSAQPFVCKVNPKTIKTCSTAFDTPCAAAACEPATGACLLQPRNNGLPCDDGAPCTKGDFCKAGQCAAGTDICTCAADVDCLGKDDGNLCNGVPFCDKSKLPWQCETNPATVVSCPSVDDTLCRKALCTAKTGICELQPINQGIACDDGSACTAGELCKDGGCTGAKVDCDDGVPCTTDACDKAIGCTHTLAQQLCDDGQVCTTDLCDPKASGADALGCAHKAQTGASCDDGDACTSGDACLLGVCTGKALGADGSKGCDDGNPCTDDGCDKVTGCTHANNAAPCKTDKPCQPVGVCATGACVPMAAPMWSALVDGKADEAPAAVGAAADGSAFVVGRSVPVGGKDADAQLWAARVAAGGASVLWSKELGGGGDDAAFAVATVQTSANLGDAAGPNDVAAIVAGRRGAGSKGGADGWLLRLGADGNPTWQQHVGGPGDDAAHAVVSWGGGEVAFAGRLGSGETSAAWMGRVDKLGTMFWTAVAQPQGTKSGAAWAVDRAVASDGSVGYVFAGGRTSSKGVAGAFAAKVDETGQPLWDVELGVGKSGDTSDVARALRATPTGGALVAGGNGAAGRIVALDAAGKVGWDLGFGAAGGGAFSGLGALHEGSVVAVGTTKGDGADAGKQVVWLLRIDLAGTLLWQRTLQPTLAGQRPQLSTTTDGRMAVGSASDATLDKATIGLGARVQMLDAWGFESCDVQGACQGKTRADCDDANPCTHELCSAELGCGHQLHALPCDDGDSCSLGDACKLGACKGSATACDDGNPCTIDLCAAGKGCSHSKQDGPCDDGDPCSKGEACVAGVCQPGKLVDCDDGNVCTDDSCDKTKGCTSVANTAACDTGSCTVLDTCDKTLCKTSGKLRYTTTWHGQGGDDQARAVAPLADNGLLLVGQTWTNPDGDGLVVRTDAVGKAVWQSVVQGPKGCCGGNSNQANSVDDLRDGMETPFGVFVVGRTSICVDQAWAAMLDTQGKTVWSKPVIFDNVCGSGGHRGLFQAVAAGNDATWAAAGWNLPYPFTTYRGYFVRFNQSGTIVSQKVGIAARQIWDLASRPIGGYFAASEVQNAGHVDGRIQALDGDGDPIWNLDVRVDAAPSTGYDTLHRVVAMPDGGALAVGFGGPVGARQMLVVRASSIGKLLYAKVLGGASDELGVAAIGHGDGSALIGATTWSQGPGAGDLWFVGLDPAGNQAFQRVHGTTGAELLADFTQRADGSVASVATATEPGEVQPDVQLRTFDAWGYGDCKTAGTCAATSALSCDDANPCTLDLCDAAKACHHANLADGSACGAGQSCKSGACVSP